MDDEMNSTNIELINEKKALEESIKSMESFNESVSKSRKTKFLLIGAFLFLVSFTVLIKLQLPFEAFLIGVGIAFSVVFIHFASLIGKTAFYAKYTQDYVDVEAMRKRLGELEI